MKTVAELLRHSRLRRGSELSSPTDGCRTTGFEQLDKLLPGGGWPKVGLTEILSTVPGASALRLLFPCLAYMSQQGGKLVWVAPPHVPNAPVLEAAGINLEQILILSAPEGEALTVKDKIWLCEQALRVQESAAVLLWNEKFPSFSLRKLHLAAESGQTWGVLLRSRDAGELFPSSMLRLSLSPLRDVTPRTGRRTRVRLLSTYCPAAGQECLLGL